MPKTCEIWLEPIVALARPEIFSSCERLPESFAAKPNKHFAHADHLLSSSPNEMQRIDAILALKRATEIRLKDISDKYQFRRMPFGSKRTGVIERLEQLGVIRNQMLFELNGIRNKIEHFDDSPPSQKECARYLEFVWYFLRTTDQMVRTVNHGYESGYLRSHNNLCEFTVNTGPSHNWEIELVGWFPSMSIARIEQAGWLKISAEKIETREALIKRTKENDRLNKYQRLDDLWIVSKVLSPPELIESIVKNYFAPELGGDA